MPKRARIVKQRRRIKSGEQLLHHQDAAFNGRTRIWKC